MDGIRLLIKHWTSLNSLNTLRKISLNSGCNLFFSSFFVYVREFYSQQFIFITLSFLSKRLKFFIDLRKNIREQIHKQIWWSMKFRLRVTGMNEMSFQSKMFRSKVWKKNLLIKREIQITQFTKRVKNLHWNIPKKFVHTDSQVWSTCVVRIGCKYIRCQFKWSFLTYMCDIHFDNGPFSFFHFNHVTFYTLYWLHRCCALWIMLHWFIWPQIFYYSRRTKYYNVQ